jgi:hypothetical protein
MINLSFKRVGGLRFIKVARLNITLSISKPLPDADDWLTDEEYFAKKSHLDSFEDFVNSPLNPIQAIASLLFFLLITTSLLSLPSDTLDSTITFLTSLTKAY